MRRGVGASGTGSRHGGPQADTEAFTETRWVTLRGDLPAYPFPCHARQRRLEAAPGTPRQE